MGQRQAEDPLKVIFNYNNVFYSFFYDDTSGCTHRSREFAMNYVYSGEMVVDNGHERIHVGKGECVFIPRDHHITLYKRTCDGERYCGIFLMFTRAFLKEMYDKFGRREIPTDTPKLDSGVIKLPRTAEIASLFASMTPYFDPEVKPHDDFMQLKLQEGLLALLHIDRRFAPTLFDFNEPWKIDILDFMNRNYMYEFTVEELAHYTGRSLATFKRDFKKVSDLTPEKWLIRKRLEVAYALMKEGGRKIADVYTEVGFKNQSHFSSAFKKLYGVAPSAVSV
ncbi:MAG TPA: AraC family transcriptional regulator [Candidatus Parabacteroides intestinigallinarum]|uniref:AraC family transcriptional regulator n=1 Tax=Candidatus Parabacteroides intestinigallinarum TaxID=2838722 RepID=A0A9D2BPY0_9BACT|nr:AraC family transcriptional regulator [Candidatus Parabacteroides intestinigallinarum]